MCKSITNDEEIIFQPKTEAIYKIIVIGDPSVGKTSLLTKFATQKFNSIIFNRLQIEVLSGKEREDLLDLIISKELEREIKLSQLITNNNFLN